MGLGFVVTEWAAIGPSMRTRAAWAAWARGATVDAAAQTHAALPPILRRRITPIGQMAFEAAQAAQGAAEARFVFASRHGEFRRTLSLLETLLGDETVSPADFSLSVHNALMGLLSIWSRNPRGHTTIASGTATFHCALIEAASMLVADTDTPVLLVFYDEPLPAPYDGFNGAADGALALALLLKSTGDGARVSIDARSGEAAEIAQPLDFIRFLVREEHRADSRPLRVSSRAQREAA